MMLLSVPSFLLTGTGLSAIVNGINSYQNCWFVKSKISQFSMKRVK
jgi:hypothetical protein